jgi:two-component system chemotaxis sensor kinase CheA
VSDAPEDRMSELHQLFFESAGELVQKLNDEAMRLEVAPGDAETARSLRRTVHTLKGDAAACGFRELSELSHEFEDVLTLENTAAAASVPEIALRAADVFAALLEAYRNGTTLPNVQSLRADIARLAHPAPDVAAKTTGSAAPKNGPKKKKTGKTPAKASPWSEYERLTIARALSEGRRAYHIVMPIDPQCDMPIAARQMVRVALDGLGEILAFYPVTDSPAPMERIEVAIVSEKPAEQILAKCSIPTVALNVRVKPLRAVGPSQLIPPTLTAASQGNSERNSRDETENKNKHKNKNNHLEDLASPATPELPPVAANEAPATGEAIATPVVPGSPDNLLRVDAERIDSVLNLVGELILAKSMLQQALLEFGHRFPKDVLRGKFADAMAFQSRVLNDLQHSVMKIRMVPVDQLFRRFPRIVRDVGRQCGKEVELMVRGGQTDLDKSILDAIAEPLTHMVRNAVDHGIETPEERVRAGKRPKGTLRLGAYHQGNQVVVELSDDGGGIDAEKVRQRAISRGLLSVEQAARMTETEALDLILQPGFSTAEEITEISGRGVGLDVVQSVLGRLKGTIQIETAIGRGTTFRLRLPLTLAIIRALMFRVEHRLYALPLNAVAEIARTVEEEIHQVEHYDVLQLRNDVLPLLRLGSRPPSGPEAARQKVFVLVINSGDRKFGVLVDALEGEDELVIKALDDQSITTDLVSGASILGDGRVVLILNMIALMDRFTQGRTDTTGARMAGLLSSVVRAGTSHGVQPGEMQSRGAAGSLL